MKAVFVTTPGPASNLTYGDVPTPTPAPGQALVKIVTSGVNFIDVYFRTGLYKADSPILLGMEASGVVEAVAPDVTVVKPGDRVAYAMARGSYAEYDGGGQEHQCGDDRQHETSHADRRCIRKVEELKSLVIDEDR